LISDSIATNLEYYTRRQKLQGAMEPNTKIFIEQLMKEVHNEIHSLQKDMKDSFATQDASINSQLTEITTSTQQREECVAMLESTATDADKVLTVWKPAVESSLSSIKLGLTKFNSFFAREGKTLDTTSPGVLSGGAASSRSSLRFTATSPNGHRVDTSHRACGSEGVYTQTHDPIKGMQLNPPPNPSSPHQFSSVPDSFQFMHHPSSDQRHMMGKLPKMNFPKFEGDNPKLWQ
jgi:hypothetical protein